MGPPLLRARSRSYRWPWNALPGSCSLYRPVISSCFIQSPQNTTRFKIHSRSSSPSQRQSHPPAPPTHLGVSDGPSSWSQLSLRTWSYALSAPLWTEPPSLFPKPSVPRDSHDSQFPAHRPAAPSCPSSGKEGSRCSAARPRPAQTARSRAACLPGRHPSPCPLPGLESCAGPELLSPRLFLDRQG